MHVTSAPAPVFFPAVLMAPAGEGLSLPLAMLVVFGSAKLLAELFERLRQPGIVGEILAGMLIGPAVLGWIRPNQFLGSLAELGVMFLLFRVGLEVKSSELMGVGRTALLVAVLGVALPFVLGWGILLAWGESQVEAIFVGTAMVATSVGITAQVLASKGYLSSQSAKIILAAAVIDDVLGLLVLAVVSSVARGQVNLLALGSTALLAIGFTFIVAKWGTPTVRRVAPRVQERLRGREAQFAMAMCLLFALSWLAAYLGVAAIVGAFLAGMALSESAGRRVQDLSHGVTELLVPFFLAGIGLHLDIRALAQPSVLLLSLVILVAAMLSKFVGCGLGALGMGRGDAVRVGVGMVPRGEVGMVVAQIGLGMGVMGAHVYGVVVFMAVATTLVAPPLLVMAYRGLPPAEPLEEEVFHLG